jgi:hypothetical protein
MESVDQFKSYINSYALANARAIVNQAENIDKTLTFSGTEEEIKAARENATAVIQKLI